MASEITSLLPPLLGDGHGRYRIHIVGNSGVGKSTLAQELSTLLGIPFVNLDKIFWRPGWQSLSREELRKTVTELVAQYDNGWIIDGNFFFALGNLLETYATDTIWLDPPLVLYFPRVILRTFRRMLKLDPPCSPGCEETIRGVFFSRESILWWCLTNHRVSRKRERERLRTQGIHVGGTYRRIGGWGGELEAWKKSVRDMVAAQSVSDCNGD
ncbi:AAA domain-containing protein [Irpex lacteus]|nr:AAA domain-containing protein [Irpex lacteus]